ncbi:MAG: hypothetical protein JKY19_01775, partial [Alcanivoracaceae bacterium]|nr:hypothetical protein [Alcanivoracaceae bacterium]
GQYHTEQNSFAKITNTTAGFTVQTKSGRTHTYVQQQSPNNEQETTWQLKQETDSFGNSIIYDYQVHGTNEWLLNEIIYTVGLTIAGDRKVKFNYEDRQIAYATKFLAGETTESTKKLENIIITTPQGTYRTYDFSYVSDTTENLLLLDTVRETAKDNTGSSRIVLDANWQGDYSYNLVKPGDLGLNQVTPTVISLADIQSINEEIISRSQTNTNQIFSVDGTGDVPIPITRLQVAPDLNGDGTKELVSNMNTLLFYNAMDELKGYLTLTGRSLSLNSGRAHADYNGDGITDLVLFPESNNDFYEIAMWQGTEIDQSMSGAANIDDFFRFYATPVPKLEDTEAGNVQGINSHMSTADFDNDGLPDLIYRRLYNAQQCTEDSQYCTHNIYYRKNMGIDTNQCIPRPEPYGDICNYNPSFAAEVEIAEIIVNNFNSSLSQSFVLKDLNGDGHTDILINGYKAELIKAYFYNLPDSPGVFSVKSADFLGLTESGEQTMIRTYGIYTDLNADGLDDFLYVANKSRADGIARKWQYKLNTGKILTSLFGDETPIDLSGIPIICGDSNSTDYTCRPRDAAAQFYFTDINSDGINDILFPNVDDVLIDICMTADIAVVGGIPQLYHDGLNDIELRAEAVICSYTADLDPSDPNSPGPYESFSFYDYKGAFAKNDLSVYGYKAFILEPTKNINGTVKINAFAADTSQYPTVYKKIGSTTATGDFFGDGDEDYFSRLVCAFQRSTGGEGGALGCEATEIKFNEHTTDDGTQTLNQYVADNYPGLSVTQAKTLISENIVITNNDTVPGEFFLTRNDSIVSGLVATVTKPSHNLVTEWTYKPLSTDASDRSGFPLYSVPDRFGDDSYVDEENNAGEHFYFNSSMYVVSEMRQSNNYGGNSLNEYAYEEAVYNNQGRGFQGFRKIKVRSNPDESSVLYETVSESTFHQVFPLAGRLESVKVIQDTVTVSEENYCYRDQIEDAQVPNTCPNGLPKPAIGSIVFHPLVHKHSVNKELNGGGKASETDTTLNYDYSYGNITEQSDTVATFNIADANALLRSETTSTNNSYYAIDEANWWVDKLKQTSVNKTATDSSGNVGTHLTYSTFLWKADAVRQLECQYTSLSASIQTNCNDSNINNNDVSKNSFVY